MNDKSTQHTAQNGEPAAHSYLHGLRASVRNNASAYGFSVTITASFGLLTTALGTPTAPEIFAFAGGAVAAFALVELVVSRGFTRGLEDEPSSVKELGSSISILSVGVAIACAYGVGRLVGGFVAWPLGSFVATSGYLFLFGVELSLAHRIQRRRANKSG
ncbi:MAG: hypothetical protein M3R38_11590 [Actinomycetota bacterium]|nr:hypothetical protein [Actinomycetota bacterium]